MSHLECTLLQHLPHKKPIVIGASLLIPGPPNFVGKVLRILARTSRNKTRTKESVDPQTLLFNEVHPRIIPGNPITLIHQVLIDLTVLPFEFSSRICSKRNPILSVSASILMILTLTRSPGLTTSQGERV